jgi:para-nitrobenzyl esterase
MRTALFALALVLANPALAQTPAPAPAYSVVTTTIGELLDKPALKAIFEKYLPEIAGNERVSEGRALTLPEIVQYAADIVTPDKLAAIDAELKALPPQ